MRTIRESLSGIAGKVHELLGGSQSDGAPLNSTSVPNDQTEQIQFARMPSVEAIPAPVVSRSGKRGRSGEEISPGSSSKSNRRGGNANQLIPNYRQPPPPKSTQIAVPVYNPGADWKLEQTPAMGAPHRSLGGVKPINTLGQSFHQGARTTQPYRLPAQSSSGYGIAIAKAARQQGLEVSKSKGSNVGTPLGMPDDTEPQPRAAKRRRVGPTPRSDTVDLTSDDEDFQDRLDLAKGQAIPARNAGKSAASQHSATAPSDSSRRKQKGGGDAFGNNELYSVDQQSHNWHPRGRMKSGYASVQQNVSEVRSLKNQAHPQIGTAQTPMDVDADDLVMPHGDPEKVSSRVEEQGGAVGPPVIDLEKGLKEAGEEHKQKRQKREQGSIEDLDQVNDVMATAGYRRPVANQKRARPSSAVARRSITQHPPPAASLNKKFVRDIEEIEDDDPPVKSGHFTNAQTRVQSPSDRPNTRGHSPDVLHGESTVKSQIPRNLSSKKLVPVISSQKVRTGASIRASTSCLQPTNFTQSQQHNVPAGPRDDEDIWNLSEDFADDGSIPIVSIASKAIVNSDHGLALRWDPSSKSFLLENGQDFVKSPLDNRVVSIGASAVSMCWTGHDQSKKVSMKGSKSDTSSGTILIEFATLQGKWGCYNGLHESFEGLSTKTEDPGRLEKIFANMNEEQVRAHRQALKAVHNRANESQIAALRRKQSAHEQGDEDQIVYGDEPLQPRRKKLVEGMKGEMLSDEVLAEQAQQSTSRRTSRFHDETKSQYFASGEPTRRSTRQSKPTAQYRETSPELVKWTARNGLPKWAKPVVYPEQGTRRVTIDAQDLMHLDAGEFLNDNIVNYALRDIEENLPDGQKHRFHFFNTFFFTSLTVKNGKKAFNYEAVMKWTKNVDLFTKEFVVVPINLDLHWFVVIIHNLPSIRRRLLDSDMVEQPADEDTVDSGSDDEATPTQSDGPQSELEQLTLHDNAEPVVDDAVFDNVKLPGDDMHPHEVLHSKVQPKKGGKKKPIAPVRKFSADVPSVVSLDSFGANRTNEAGIIKDYIIEEAREKRRIEVVRKDLQGINASGISRQSNFYDCGVYLIGYMKEFARDPDSFMARILRREPAAGDFTAFDTSALRDEVRENLLEYGNMANEKYKSEKLAKRKAQSENGGKTPSRNLASSMTALAHAGEDTAPTTSQGSRNSPAAHASSGREATPSAAKTLGPFTNAVRDSSEPSTSTTFLRGSHEACDPAEGKNDDLELGIPRPLRTSKSPRPRHVQSPCAIDDNATMVSSEMLVPANVSERNTRTGAYESVTTPPRRGLPVHNSKLSPLSSLEKDASLSPGQLAPGVFDARATVTGSDMSLVENKEEAKKTAADAKEDDQMMEGQDEEQDETSDATAITSEIDAEEADNSRLTVCSIGDKGEIDPVEGTARQVSPGWNGSHDNSPDRAAEIPESQPETQRSQSL